MQQGCWSVLLCPRHSNKYLRDCQRVLAHAAIVIRVLRVIGLLHVRHRRNGLRLRIIISNRNEKSEFFPASLSFITPLPRRKSVITGEQCVGCF